jgi:hypothetical protein
MSDVFGAVGAVAGAAIQANAIENAAEAQIRALERQRAFVFQQLDPATVGGQATAADLDQIRNRLSAQALFDPSLLQARYNTSDAILRQSGELGSDSTASRVGGVAANEAIAGVPGMGDLKTRLIDEALKEINAGATLPPDVQAELVKAGLEKSGMVTGAASPRGVGGNVLRELIGTAGLALKAQRQERAAKLAGDAQSLEESRQRILGTLFPNLSTVQLNQLSGQQSVLNQSNAMVPEVGLSGQDVANIWLARVGATNQLAQSAADAQARAGMGVAQAWQQGLGNAVGYAANALPSTSQLGTSLGNWWNTGTFSSAPRGSL